MREAMLCKLKEKFKDSTPNYVHWNKIKENANSYYDSNFFTQNDQTKRLIDKSVHVYFPPNRFEEPAWLNEKNLLNKIHYKSFYPIQGYSYREVINYSPMKDLQNWLLDLIYDAHAIEKQTLFVPPTNGQEARFIQHQHGPATTILDQIGHFIKVLFEKEGNLTWDIGSRNRQKICFSINGQIITRNLFQLSTGQIVLLGLFMSIIRDFDFGSGNFSKLDEIEGIVIIDEVDLHLHANLQHDLLPKLMKLFKRVQFIITTHSPLFVMGLQKIYDQNGFHLFEFPEGKEIASEKFSEFESAYNYMRETSRFEKDLRAEIEKSNLPIVYFEGQTDIDYVSKAAKILDRVETLKKFQLVDAGGAPRLNKIWDSYKGALAMSLSQRIILLYDCDQNKEDRNEGYMFRRILPQHDRKIVSGIENIFPDDAMSRAKDHKQEIFDIDTEHTKIIRGKPSKIPERWKINGDEKRNLCDWLYRNGTPDDFAGFNYIFDALEEILEINIE